MSLLSYAWTSSNFALPRQGTDSVAWKTIQCRRLGSFPFQNWICFFQGEYQEIQCLYQIVSSNFIFTVWRFPASFVRFEQISKYVESLTIGRKGVRFSHGPDWAREVLFCQEKLIEALEETGRGTIRMPVFLSPIVNVPLEAPKLSG